MSSGKMRASAKFLPELSESQQIEQISLSILVSTRKSEF